MNMTICSMSPRLTYAGADTPLTYDDDSLLTGVGSISLSRHPGNGLVETIQDGTFSMALTWNEFGEVASRHAVHGSDLYQVTYTRDKLGRIAEKQETVNGSTATFVYDYDAVGRLISMTRDGSLVETASYDSAGNRTACRSDLAGVNLASGSILYDADHKLISAGTTTYQYDTDGNLIQENRSGTITSFQYNTDGTLARVDLPDGRVITYLYDHAGRRVARAVDGSRTHAWLYGTGLMPLAEFDGTGALRQRFVYAGGPVPLVCERGGQTYHIITDQIGSPILVSDDSGAVVKQVSYDTWGNVLSDTNPAFDLPFGFAGSMADPDHELIRFGVRDYQPSTGRWTAKDPILFNGGLNLYAYAGSDPVNLVDQEGKRSKRKGSLEDLLQRYPSQTLRVLPKVIAHNTRNPIRAHISLNKAVSIQYFIDHKLIKGDVEKYFPKIMYHYYLSDGTVLDSKIPPEIMHDILESLENYEFSDCIRAIGSDG